MPDIKKIHVTNIDWDTDDADPSELGLPDEVTIDITDDNVCLLEEIDGYADNLLDYLSDTYGYCIKGFNADTE